VRARGGAARQARAPPSGALGGPGSEPPAQLPGAAHEGALGHSRTGSPSARAGGSARPRGAARGPIEQRAARFSEREPSKPFNLYLFSALVLFNALLFRLAN
jgi:hypothetical protein